MKKSARAIRIAIWASSLFLDRLKDEKQPQLLKNVRKMKGYDERYRWRVGNYRVIGLIKDKELIIEIIKIATRQRAYKD